jgi:hypothetical protein
MSCASSRMSLCGRFASRTTDEASNGTLAEIGSRRFRSGQMPNKALQATRETHAPER